MVTVTIDLPFHLRLERPIRARFEKMCPGPDASALDGKTVTVSFDRRDEVIDRSGMHHVRTTLRISVPTPRGFSNEAAGASGIGSAREIANRLITGYQAVTQEVTNAGFVRPLGTSEFQLFADIRLNGRSIRDRWPFHTASTFPVEQHQERELVAILRGSGLPISRWLLTNARLQLEQGQSSIAVVQAATAVETAVNSFIVRKLQRVRWPREVVEEYEKTTLGSKLNISRTDRRSLEHYGASIPEVVALIPHLKDRLNRLRNDIVHRGHIATMAEALAAYRLAAKAVQGL